MPTVVTGLQRTLRVLAATPNTAAIYALTDALGSDREPLRVGAARTLAARRDKESHHRLMLALADSPDDVRAAVSNSDAMARLRKSAIAALAGADPELQQCASRYAVDADDHRLLPAIAGAVLKTTASGDQLAKAALRLARSLAEKIEARERGLDKSGEDPAFARSEALKSLSAAVRRYSEHKKPELIEAYLTLATYHHPTLGAVLKDNTHKARRPLLDLLEHCPAPAAMDVLIGAMEDPDSLEPLLELAASRGDRAYVARLLGRCGERPGVRVLQNARRLAGFAWAEPAERRQLLLLGDAEQAAAVRLFTAADTGAEDRLDLVEMMLRQGSDAARVAACEAIRRMKADRVSGLITLAMQDPCPEVLAVAAGQLRRYSMENGLPQLVALLDHESAVVVAAAQKALGEFSLDSYRKSYAALTPRARALAGPLVAKADPEAVGQLAKELASPINAQRLEALSLIAELGIVDKLTEEVIVVLQDSEAPIRSEAARVLGAGSDPRAIEALAGALGDDSGNVAAAAEASLRRLDALDVAQQLVDRLAREAAPGDQGEEGSA